MSQTTLDDEELFSEAASEMREDVEASLADARDELPDADAVWEIEGDNSLGFLNSLKSALGVGGAREHLRDAKKWFTVGKEADAFEDAEELAEEIETVESLVADVETAHEQVGDLASTIPQLQDALESADGADTDSDTGTAEA
ncbi:MAG: DUF5790 family protein [Halovenus sp.]